MTFGTPLVYLYSFLNMSLNEGELLASCPGRFTLPKNPQYLLNRRFCGPDSRSEPFREEENFLPLLGFKPRIVKISSSLPGFELRTVQLYRLSYRL